jgi:YHS domain-containing protein
MPATENLAARLEAEFAAFNERIRRDREERIRAFHERQERLAALEPRLEQLVAFAKPRVETVAKQFGNQLQIAPKLERTRGEASFHIRSELANIRMRFSVAPDTEARKLVFRYELSIVPALTSFESHGEIEFPIDQVDEEALAAWFDDRLVTFVQTYLSIQENHYYLKDHMVTDPVAGVSFPKHAAGATLEQGGKTYYFLGEETRREFQEKQKQAQ